MAVRCGGRAQPERAPTTREVFVDVREGPLPERGGLPSRTLALTFDDGPDPATTRKILDILERHDVLATFFQVGRSAEEHPELSREILERGHSLGSHSWDHADLTELSLDEAVTNVRAGHEAVEEAVGATFHNPFSRSFFVASVRPSHRACTGARTLDQHRRRTPRAAGGSRSRQV